MDINISDYPNGFVVTGRLYNSNTRFKRTFPAGFQGAFQCFAINLWNGSRWGILENGKRKLIQRVYN